MFNRHLCQVGQKLAEKFSDNPPFINTLNSVRSEFICSPIKGIQVDSLVDKIKNIQVPCNRQAVIEDPETEFSGIE